MDYTITVPDKYVLEYAQIKGYKAGVRNESTLRTELKEGDDKQAIINQYWEDGAKAVNSDEIVVIATFITYPENAETPEEFAKRIFAKELNANLENIIKQKKLKDAQKEIDKYAKEKTGGITIK